ncbi:MAG: translocation/assembly module TamB domain-containing protein, partial [Myxococcota bacterium]
LCAELQSQLSATVEGTLTLRCERVEADHVELRNVRLTSPEGTTLARRERVSADVDLASLANGRIVARRVALERPLVDLQDLAAWEALVATDEEEPSDAPLDLPDIEVSRVQLREGSVLLPDGWRLRGISLDAAVFLGTPKASDIRAVVHSLEAAAERNDTDVARVAVEGTLDVDGESELRVEVASESDRLHAQATLHALERFEGELNGELSPAIFEALGEPNLAEEVSTAVTLHSTFEGQTDGGTATATIDTDGGQIALRGGWGTEFFVEVDTQNLALGALARSLPDASASASLRARLTLDGALTVHGTDLAYDGYVLPEIELEGTVDEEALSIRSVDLPHLRRGGHFDLTGRVGFDGETDLRLDADLPQLARDANLRRLAPGMQSALRANLRIQTRGPEIDAQGTLRASSFSFAGASADSLEIRGRVSGRVAAPVVNATLRGQGIRSGQLRAESADVSITGGPRPGGPAYRLVGQGADGPRTLRADVTLRQGERDLTLDGLVTANAIWSAPVEARLDGVAIQNGRVDLRGVRVTSRDGLSAEVAGTLGRQSDLRLSVVELDLAELDRRAHLGLDLAGTARVRLILEGSLRAPEGRLEGEVEGLSAKNLPASEVTFRGTVSQQDARALISASFDLQGPLARANGNVAALFPERDPQRDPLNANLDIDLNVESDDLSILVQALELPPLEGGARINLEVGGTPNAPLAALQAHGTALRFQSGDPLTLHAEGSLQDGHAQVETSIGDERGSIASLRASLANLDPTAVSPEDLLREPPDLAVEVDRRRLDELPRPWRIAQPISVEGRVRVDSQWRGEGSLLAFHQARDSGCENDHQSRLHAGLRLEDDVLRVELTGTVDGSQTVSADTEFAAPVATWLSRGLPEVLPAVRANATIASLPLAALPVACEQATGALSLDLEAEGLLTERPEMTLGGNIADLQLGEAEPINLRLGGVLSPRHAEVRAHAVVDGREALRAAGSLPIRWEQGVQPTLRDQPWEADVRLTRMPIAPLVAPVPVVVQPSGSVDGNVHLAGIGADATARGALELQSISATITDPYLRLEDLRGAVRLDDAGLTLDNLQYRDRDGRFRVNGHIAIEGTSPERADLTVSARQMPMRVDGVTYAIVDAEATIDATLADEPRVNVALRRMTVEVPEAAGRQLQSSETHPDVLFVDEVGFETARRDAWREVPDEERETTTSPPGPPLRVRVDAEPFWVRRDDFSVQLRAGLDITTGAQTTIAGPLDVRRGFIELLGRSFDFERGEIRFAGGREVDPILDLAAVHTLRTGETVTVNITGHLTRPELAFSSSAPGVESTRDVLALLVRGRTDSTIQTAQEQATSALAGLMAGFLSSLTRSEFGRYVPVFRVESEGAGSARIRAGFTADSIIPEILRDVVLGAYVEGFVGTEQDEGDGSQQVTGGFLIELLFPRSIVGRGSYQQPANWSIDLTWEPL